MKDLLKLLVLIIPRPMLGLFIAFTLVKLLSPVMAYAPPVWTVIKSPDNPTVMVYYWQAQTTTEGPQVIARRGECESTFIATYAQRSIYDLPEHPDSVYTFTGKLAELEAQGLPDPCADPNKLRVITAPDFLP